MNEPSEDRPITDITTTPITKKIISSAYDWNEGDYDWSDHVSVLAWTLNQKSEPMLLRFEDFPAFCYIELPLYVNQRRYSWNQSSAKTVIKWLTYVLAEDAPEKGIYREMSKLYYYRSDQKFPMILLTFKTIKAMKHCEALLKKPRDIKDIGLLAMKVWEMDISLVRKMLTTKECRYSQWFEIDGVKVSNEYKISTLEHEYMVNWRTLKPISNDETKGWVTNPRILVFDIESYSDNHKAFPEKYSSKHVAYMISCIYQRIGQPDTRKKYVILMGDSDEADNVNIIRVKTEKELCDKFIELIADLDPEIISGYNILGFDYPYLDARLSIRANKWNNKASRLHRTKIELKSSIWSSSGYGHNEMHVLNMPGRISIDLLPVVRRDYKLPKYDLNTVGNHFLNRGKHDISAIKMFEIYELFLVSSSINEFCQNNDKVDSDVIKQCHQLTTQAKTEMNKVLAYCVEDSELVLDIIEKINVWIGLIELSNIVGVTPVDIFMRGQQIRGVSQIYNLATSKGYVLDKRVTEKTKFEGAFVFDPKPGLYDNVMCLDFKSLYPSIIIALNICHTTLIPPEMDTIIPDDMCNVITWTETIDDDDDDDEEETEMKTNLSNGKVITYRFRFIKREHKIGILPSLVENLVFERNMTRKQAKKETDDIILTVLDKRQNALKVSANSIYGMLGVQEKGKLPLIEGAMCVTASGRKYIKMVIKYIVDKYEAIIVYGDTDSAMFQLPFIKTGQEANEWGYKLEKEISDLFPEALNVEFEKAGRSFNLKKKKYAFWMLDKKGELMDPHDPKIGKSAILTKGIVIARRDNCAWQRDVFWKVMLNILERKGMQSTLDIIVKECVRILRGEVDWTDLTVIRGLGASYKLESYFMKVFSDELRRIGKPAQAGDRLEYLIVSPNDPTTMNDNSVVDDKLLGYRMRLPSTYLERLKSNNPEHIDAMYYLEKALMNSIEQLWQIGYNRELAALNKYYTQLDNYKVINEVSMDLAANTSRYEQHIQLLTSIVSSGEHINDINGINGIDGNESNDKDYEKIVATLLESPLKNRTILAKRKYISGRSVINYRINDHPIKLIIKAVIRDELQKAVSTLASPELYSQLYP